MESKKMLTKDQIDGAIAFHGHHCPGLTIGLRAAQWCLQNLGRAGDEDIVAVAETDMCADDAIQYLTGCTFGKGNFIFRDTGKAAFTFYRRSDNKRGRLVLNPDFAPDLQIRQEALSPDQKEELALLRQERTDRMMKADLNDLFIITVPDGEIPHRARIHKTVRCAICGEGVMEPRLQTVNGQKVCIDCAKKEK
ncbi:MAG: FmdE family protein [Planctomycetia bacterium]|nr:FmdE family protein [Planctomycetia bacterium]